MVRPRPQHEACSKVCDYRLRVAARDQQAIAAQASSIYDRIWEFTEWYRNDKARLVQRVQFSGRYQHDFALVRSDQADHEEWNIRRMRLGGRVTLLGTFLFHGEAELNPQERNPLYVRLTDFNPSMESEPASRRGRRQIGRAVTSEGATSSRELIAIDRSNLANNILQHIVSVHTRLEEPTWCLRTDFSRATGYLGNRTSGV